LDTAEHNEGGAVPVKTLMLELKSDSGRVTIYIESKILQLKGRRHVFTGEGGGCVIVTKPSGLVVIDSHISAIKMGD